jgi:hypothetical protein
MTHDYKRNGTTTLFAALDIATGKVIGECLVHNYSIAAVKMEGQDASPYSLSDEQVADAQRRLADPNPKSVTLQEVRRLVMVLACSDVALTGQT